MRSFFGVLNNYFELRINETVKKQGRAQKNKLFFSSLLGATPIELADLARGHSKMRSFARILYGVFFAALVGIQVHLFAEEAKPMEAGVAASVEGEVKAVTPPAKTAHPLRGGDTIFMGDKIETGADGQLQIALLDKTVFTLGPLSSITVDEFVYDPNNAENQGSMVKGVLRAVSSKVTQQRPVDVPAAGRNTSEESFPKAQEDALKLADLIAAKDAGNISEEESSGDKSN